MNSNFLQPTILETSRITASNRPSLVDKIFSNLYDKNIDSGNLLGKTSGHLPISVTMKHVFNKNKTQSTGRNLKLLA